MAKEIATKTKLDTRIAADIAAAMPVANQPAAVKAAAAPALAKKAIVIDTEEVQAAVEQAVEGSADVIVAQAAAASTGAAAGGAAAAGMSTTALVVAGVAVAAAAGGGSSSSSSPAAVTPTPSTPAATPAPATLSVTLTSVADKQDYSSSTSNITMVVNGDDDATEGDEFNIKLGSGNDTVTLDTYLTATVNAGAGNDTLNLKDVGLTLGAGNADVNLETGVASSQLAGTFINFENVIAHDDGGRLVGTSGANTITLGEGTDDISAASGDDLILADGDTLTANDDIDGGSGTDTLSIDGEDTLNISTAFDALTAVENILVTGTEDNDVTLTFAAMFDSTSTSAISGGMRNIKIADKGGANTASITAAAANDINLIGVTFTNVQTLDLDAGTGTDNIRIDANSLNGVETVDGTAGDQFVLGGGTYDFSKVEINTMTEIDGSATANDIVKFGSDIGDIVDVDLGASVADELSFAATDVGNISALTTLTGVETLSYGTASRVVIDDGHLANLGAVKGSASTADVLVLQGTTADGTTSAITGVETIVVDAGGSAIGLTIGASTLEAGVTVLGDSNGSDEVILGANGVDISKVTFKDFEILDFAAKTASISTATLSTFSKIDGTANGILTLTDSGALTLKGTMTGAGRIQGASGDDTWTFATFSDGTTAVDIRLGAGNDTVSISSGNTLANALFKMEDGDDTFSIGSDTTVVAGTVTGGNGSDTLKFSDATVAATAIAAADFAGFETLAWASASTAAISLELGATDVQVNSIDFSADTSSTGANTINLTAYTASGYSVTGSAGADTIKMGATTSSVNGGAGNDTIEITGVALATAAEAQTFTVSGGSAGTDVYDFKADAVTATVGQHTLVINDYSAGDDIDVAEIVAATTSGAVGAVELTQAVAQALVDAAAPGSLAAAFEALNDHAEALGVSVIGAFQYNGNTYVYIDGDDGAAYDKTEDFFIKVTGLHTIAAADLLTA